MFKLKFILLLALIPLALSQFDPLDDPKCCLTRFGLDCVTDTRAGSPVFKTCSQTETCCFTNATAGVVFQCCPANSVCSANYTLANPCVPVADPNAFATIRLGIFSNNVVFGIANAKAMWAAQNLVVNIINVQGSLPQFRDLKSGAYDMVSSAVDNTINYRFNNDPPRNAIPGRFDPIQIAVADKGGVPWQLFVLPSITTYASFRGKRLGVDSPDTAFAFVAYKLLRINGLERNVDYTVLSFGGTSQRFAAITANPPLCEGAMLNGDFVFRANAHPSGLRSIGSIFDIMTVAGGGGITAKETWLKANKQVAIRFLKAYYTATNYVLDPANKAEVLAILSTLSQFPEANYNFTVSPQYGIVGDLNPLPIVIGSTVELRKEFSGFQKNYPTVLGFDTTKCMTTIGGSVYTTQYLFEMYQQLTPPRTYVPPTQVLPPYQQAFCLGFDLIAVEEETDSTPTTGSASFLNASWLAILVSLIALLYV